MHSLCHIDRHTARQAGRQAGHSCPPSICRSHKHLRWMRPTHHRSAAALIDQRGRHLRWQKHPHPHTDTHRHTHTEAFRQAPQATTDRQTERHFFSGGERSQPEKRIKPITTGRGRLGGMPIERGAASDKNDIRSSRSRTHIDGLNYKTEASQRSKTAACTARDTRHR